MTRPDSVLGERLSVIEPRFLLQPFREVGISTQSPHLVKGVMPRDGLTVVWGPPKCGKSFWVFDALMHVARGEPYRGRKVTQGPVAYVACEGTRGFRARVEAYRQRHLSEQADPPFFLCPTKLDLIADAPALIASIRTQLGTEGPVAICIDTLNRSLNGSEVDDRDMGAYVKAADTVREAFDCALVVVHHCGAEGKRPRGHTSLTGAADAQIAISKDDSGLITAAVEYMKDGEEGETVCSRLEGVEVGTDDDGDTITSCVVVPAENTNDAAARRPKLSPQARIALDHLHNAILDEGQPAPPTLRLPGQMSVVRIEVWRRHYVTGTEHEADKPDSQRRTFSRNRNLLQARGLIGISDDWVWPTGQHGQARTTSGQGHERLT